MTAREFGVKPDQYGHWPSRIPQTGMLLKGRGHESWNLLAEEEQKMGNVIFNKGGRYFSMSPEDADRAQSGPVMNFFKDIFRRTMADYETVEQQTREVGEVFKKAWRALEVKDE